MPPSVAVSQYPLALGVGAIPTMGRFNLVPLRAPRKVALPKARTPPSEDTIQYPRDWAGGATLAADAVGARQADTACIPAARKIATAATRHARTCCMSWDPTHAPPRLSGRGWSSPLPF